MESNVQRSKFKPLFRQLMVSLGVSLSVMEHSLVMGFTTIILPQLHQNPIIVLDESSASWIASIVMLVTIFGFLFALTIIQKIGRRYANFVSTLLMVTGWTCIALATNVTTIITGRVIQGTAIGISGVTSAVLIGEYTTPKYRGAFLTMMTFALLTGGLVVHSLGSCFTWYNTALICLGIAATDSVLVLSSPESPMFLASRGKYEECRKAFHWLRGFDEEEELEAMIEKAKLTKSDKDKGSKTNVSAMIKIREMFVTIKKSEFYKPLIVMMHLHFCNAWCGAIMMDVYGVDIFQVLIGKDINTMLMLLSMDSLRIISGLIAIILNTKIKRRLMIKIFMNLNVLVYFVTAGYYYAQVKQLLPFDHYLIRVVLVFFLTFTVGVGTVPIINVISGEIFPLKYKNVCTAISSLFLCLCVTVQLKTLPYLFSSIGLYGTYLLYGILTAYGMVVALIMLPETKGLTLQTIEELYWKSSSNEDTKVADELHELVSSKKINKQSE